MSWTITGPGAGDNLLYSQAGTPSLDLRFASTKSLTDFVSNRNLVTFTRASSGTFVGSDGQIKTAVTNLLTFSEQFDNAAWGNNSSSEQADATVAPNGTTTADKLIENNTTNVHSFGRGGGSESLVTGLVYTFSVYAKAGERSFVYLQATSNFAKTYFNLSTGVVSATGSGHTASIAAVGNGWYRCAITFTSDTTNNSIRAIGMAAASGTESYAGDGTSGLFLWGAQLEQSSTVGEYIPTTSTINSAPRFDHNPTTGESLGLLVEEQRTNLLVQSEDLGTSWTLVGGTLSNNSTTAPSGSQSADKLIIANGGSAGQVFQALTVTSGATVTSSFYTKESGADRIEIVLLSNNNTTPYGRATFNPITGAIAVAASTANGGTSASASVTAAGNGWYRVSVTVTYPAVTAAGVRVTAFMADSSNGDGVKGVFLWGAQLEAGAFPTSYIPTTTATVTRSADVASISGSNFSSWYRQDEGTVFADGFTTGTINNGVFAQLDDTTTANRIVLRRVQDTNRLGGVIANAGITQLAIAIDGFNSATRGKSAIGYAVDNGNIALNGVLGVQDNTLTLPTLTQLVIGNGIGSVYANGAIRRLTYWPQRLSNFTLQSITQ